MNSVKYGYDHDPYTALQAITEAQRIAFYPLFFQAMLSLRNSGLLTLIDNNGQTGASIETLKQHCTLSDYAVELLLDVGLSMRIIYLNPNLTQPPHYRLGKVGHYLLHDQMTRINTNFTQDVCYQAMFHLHDALCSGQPSGLATFGDWSTIYPALNSLPEPVKQSWFAFDHFYSDGAFAAAFKVIAQFSPKHIYDIGGNTGKWALFCVEHDPKVEVTIIDLPQQITIANERVNLAGYADRIHSHAVDLLHATQLPKEADIWWMSQFLDCFSPEQIVTLLGLLYRHMPDKAKMCILEFFGDRQLHEAGALSLNATSLYFTCVANGNSRFYHSSVFYHCLQTAGFIIEQDIDGIGFGHTLLICRKS